MNEGVDYIQTVMEHAHRMELAGVGAEEATIDLGPPAFLWRKFRDAGRETWEALPRLVAEWTLVAIPEREPSVARAKLCLSIPEDIDRETRDRMQMVFMLWLSRQLCILKA